MKPAKNQIQRDTYRESADMGVSFDSNSIPVCSGIGGPKKHYRAIDTPIRDVARDLNLWVVLTTSLPHKTNDFISLFPSEGNDRV